MIEQTREFLKHTHVIVFLQATDDNNEAVYVYLSVCAEKLTAFNAALHHFPFVPENYGTIVASGKGLPSPEVKLKMQAHYGFNEEKMIAVSPSTSET